jgi:hypothetical protein
LKTFIGIIEFSIVNNLCFKLNQMRYYSRVDLDFVFTGVEPAEKPSRNMKGYKAALPAKKAE